MEINGFQTLTVQEILNIHNILVEDFAESHDPIEPSGVREDGHLLESAASRQFVGFNGDYKYPTPIANAATLCYGVCCNHAFHNGNKRTALVSLLCHLDKNNLTFKEEVNQDELYSLMLKIASHKFAPKRHKNDTSDIEIKEITNWLHRRTRPLKKGEKVITFRELKQILKTHDIHIENPKGNFVDIVKYEYKRKRFFSKKERIGRRVAHIPYPKDGMEVGKKVLKTVREACELTEKHGYDSEMFYGGSTSIDKYIVKYKKTLKRLAKT